MESPLLSYDCEYPRQRAYIFTMRVVERSGKKSLGNWEAPIFQASCFAGLPALPSLTAGLGQKQVMIPGSRFPERHLRACPGRHAQRLC